VLAVNDGVTAVSFADDYYVGETAIAIGNPNGEGISVSQGIVSVYSEDISLTVDGTLRTHRSIRIDTPLYHGNSGGGLFNAKGELIGIANAGAEVYENINYAVPLNVVKNTAENVMYCFTDGEASTKGVCKPKLGVTVTMSGGRYVYDEELGTGRIYEDIVVTELGEGSLAARLGLKLDDKLVAMTLDGVTYELWESYVIGDLLLKMTPGTEVSVTYLRKPDADGDYVEATTATLTIALEDLSVVD